MLQSVLQLVSVLQAGIWWRIWTGVRAGLPRSRTATFSSRRGRLVMQR